MLKDGQLEIYINRDKDGFCVTPLKKEAVILIPECFPKSGYSSQ